MKNKLSNKKAEYIKYVIITALALKIFYFIFALSVRKDTGFNYNSIFFTFYNNDSWFYHTICVNDYPNTKVVGFINEQKMIHPEWAFFPLYPYLNKVVMMATQLKFEYVAIIISVLLSLLCFILFYLFASDLLKDTKKAFWATMILMCSPFAYYFSMIYTESMFLSLLIACFLAIRHKKYILFSVLFAMLTLTRINGIVAGLPLFLYFLEQNQILTKYKIDFKRIDKRVILRSLYFLLAPIALLLYCIYQYKMTGFYFAFNEAQRNFFRTSGFPLFSLESAFDNSNWILQFESIYTICFMITAIYIWRYLSLSLNVLIWIMLMLPLCSGVALSMPRFISIIFPFSIVFGVWISRFHSRATIVLILLILQFCTLYFWMANHPLSY